MIAGRRPTNSKFRIFTAVAKANLILMSPGLTAGDMTSDRGAGLAARDPAPDGRPDWTIAAAIPDHPRRTRKPWPSRNNAGTSASHETRRSALLIGGDPAQRRFCETVLQTLGVTVDAARDFQDGVRALAAFGYALVIVDAQTKGFDARAWSRLLAAKAVKDGVAPKAYLVADAGDGSGEILGVFPARDRLSRPVKSLDLVRVVERTRR